MARPAAAPTLLLSLAVLLCTVAVRPAAASARALSAATPASSLAPFARRDLAMANKVTGDEDVTNLRMTYLGQQQPQAPVAASSTAGGKTYCFEVSHFGGAGAGSCDPAASACCTTYAPVPAVKINFFDIFLSTECAVSMATEITGYKATLTTLLGPGQSANITKRTPATITKSVTSATLRISKAWQGVAELCISVPENRLNGPCGSMEKLCGPDGCAFAATTAPFKHTSGAKKKTTCSITADIPVASDACSTSPCGANTVCTNSPVGSFTCACAPGYSGDGETCVDVDECAATTSPCDANAVCTNTNGSFSCACKAGYRGDGKNCTLLTACDLLNITVAAGSARCSSADTLDWSLPLGARVASSASINISTAAAGATVTDATTPFYYSSPLNGVGSLSVVGSARNGYAAATYRPGPSASSCSSSFEETNASVMTSPAASIGGGGGHTCVLNANGTLSCAGRNDFGQLGYSGDVSHNYYTVVDSLGSDVQAIAVGGYHTCALKTNGTVFCAGYNDNGQLGLGDTSNRAAFMAVTGFGSDVQAIAAGHLHTCALKTDGTVLCAGSNDGGQLGVGDTDVHLVPTPAEGLGSDVQAISAGWYQTCALKTDGTVWCAGSNGNGALGLGSAVAQSNTFTLVQEYGSDVQAIMASLFHTCAIKTNGTVFCTGSGGSGQLGLGDDTSDRFVPTLVEGFGSDVKAIGAGFYHTCAVHKNGSVSCTGSGGSGQLGLGDQTGRLVPTLVQALGSDVQAVTGGYETTCAVKADGRVFCMGYNNFYAALGLGDNEDRADPTLVPSVQAKLPTNLFATVTDASGKAWPLKLRLNVDVECAQP